jgi:hypothetical protein
MAKRKRPIGETIGGIIAGFESQVLRSTPPPWELVQKAQPVRGVSGQDGSLLTIELPDVPTADPPPDDAVREPPLSPGHGDRLPATTSTDSATK